MAHTTIHFSTDHVGTLTYFATGIGSTAGLDANFVALEGHNASVPAIQSPTCLATDQGDLAMTQFPLCEFAASHWAVLVGGQSWVGDWHDGVPTPYASLHQMWAR